MNLSYGGHYLSLGVALAKLLQIAHSRRQPPLVQSTQQLHKLDALRDERANSQSLTSLIMSPCQLRIGTYW